MLLITLHDQYMFVTQSIISKTYNISNVMSGPKPDSKTHTPHHPGESLQKIFLEKYTKLVAHIQHHFYLFADWSSLHLSLHTLYQWFYSKTFQHQNCE